jgi:RNA polymerase sigma-70 factor (ECF subfamily)
LPAFAQYRQGGEQPWGIVVLELDDDRISRLNYFLDEDTVFPRFGVPPRLTPQDSSAWGQPSGAGAPAS